MSVTTRSQETDSCARDGCSETFSIQEAVAGSYCSLDCSDRAEAASLLAHIRQDHKYCATCFGVKKDIEPPKPAQSFDKTGSGWVPEDADSATIEWYGQETSEQAAVGFEHLTDRAERGPYGVECVCGAVSHDAVDKSLRADEPWLWHLYTTIAHLREERDKTEKRVHLVTLADELWDGADLELALGRALHD